MLLVGTGQINMLLGGRADKYAVRGAGQINMLLVGNWADKHAVRGDRADKHVVRGELGR